MLRKIVSIAVVSTAAVCVLFTATPPASQVLTVAQTLNHQKDIASELLGKMKDVFGKQKMKTAFANGVFADGIMDILHDISNQKISNQLGNNYGDINVRVLLFWARIFAFSTQQFNTIQKNLMDLKEIQKCVAEAVEQRKTANKAQLLSMFDFAVNMDGADIPDLMNEFLSAGDGGDSEDAHSHADPHSGVSSDSDESDAHADSRIGEDDYHFIVESFRAHAGCYIGAQEEQSFFLSGSLDGCVGHGRLHYIGDFLFHAMRWEVQLLHDGNIAHTQTVSNRRRRLMGTGAGSTDSCTNEIPACVTYVVIGSAVPATAGQQTIFSIDARTLSTHVIQDELSIVAPSTVTSQNPRQIPDAARELANETNFRSFIINFDKGTVGVAIPSASGAEVRVPLYSIQVNAGLSKHDFVAHVEFHSCPVGTGALLLRQRIYTHFRVDPTHLTTTVSVPTLSQSWQEFTSGPASFVNEAHALRTDEYFMSAGEGGGYPVVFNANTYTNQFVVNYDAITVEADKMWLTTQTWLTPGFETGPVSWKIGLFTLTNTDVDAQVGFEYTEHGSALVKRLYFSLDSTGAPLIRHITEEALTIDAEFGLDGLSTTPTPAVSAYDIASVVSDLTVVPSPTASPVSEASVLNAYIKSDLFYSAQIVKQFDLVLDISNRETGAVRINGSWGLVGAAVEVELFQLNLNCVDYSFRPIVRSSSAGAGLMFIDDGIKAHVDGAGNEITVPALLAYFANAHPIVFDLLALSTSVFAEETLTAPVAAITETINAVVVTFDLAMRATEFTLAELRTAKTGGSISTPFSTVAGGNVRRSVKLNYVQTTDGNTDRVTNSLLCFVSTGVAVTSRFEQKFAVSSESNVLRASSTAFSLTLVWDDPSAGVPDSVIVDQTGGSINSQTTFTFTGSEFVGAVDTDNLVFVCENGYNATANTITFVSSQIFYG